jgi:hypothetical protein
MKVRAPSKLSRYESMGTSRSCSTGIENRVAPKTYSVFSVTKEEAWFPPVFGSSRISTVSNLVRSIRAMRGVLFPLMKIHRPSASPFVRERTGWWESSQGMSP